MGLFPYNRSLLTIVHFKFKNIIINNTGDRYSYSVYVFRNQEDAAPKFLYTRVGVVFIHLFFHLFGWFIRYRYNSLSFALILFDIYISLSSLREKIYALHQVRYRKGLSAVECRQYYLNINILQRFRNKILRAIVDVPYYVSNELILSA